MLSDQLLELFCIICCYIKQSDRKQLKKTRKNKDSPTV